MAAIRVKGDTKHIKTMGTMSEVTCFDFAGLIWPVQRKTKTKTKEDQDYVYNEKRPCELHLMNDKHVR